MPGSAPPGATWCFRVRTGFQDIMLVQSHWGKISSVPESATRHFLDLDFESFPLCTRDSLRHSCVAAGGEA